MANFSYTDFYIRYPGHPSFSDTDLIEDDIVRVIVMKVEMLLFTSKGEVIGDPNFGADLDRLLFETKVSADYVKKNIVEQLVTYIPELNGIEYSLDVQFTQNPENYSDMMFIDFKVRDVEINAYFS